MPIYNYLDVSTAHIELKDSIILSESKNLMFRVLSHDYGWFINVSADVSKAELKGYNFSSDFIKLYKYALKQNCLWINLDQDAETDKNLNINNW